MGISIMPDPNRVKEQLEDKCPTCKQPYLHSYGMDPETEERWGMVECEQCKIHVAWAAETYVPGTKSYTNLFIKPALDALDRGLPEDAEAVLN